jgi:hypothetical protein
MIDELFNQQNVFDDTFQKYAEEYRRAMNMYLDQIKLTPSPPVVLYDSRYINPGMMLVVPEPPKPKPKPDLPVLGAPRAYFND